MLKKLTMMGACAASAFAMHTAEININDTDLEVNAQLDMGQFNAALEPETMYVGFKFLNADESNSDYEDSDIDPMYEVNFLSIHALGDQGFKLGMGVKANYTKDFVSVPLGLEAVYNLPFENVIPIYLHGSVYFAPKALAFRNADSFLEYRADIGVEIIPHGDLVVGYRHIDTNYEDSDFSYNSSIYFGFKIGF
jgi:hypothetical protein